LNVWPPGLYHDEAYNGLDALRVLEGARPIFFEANNGREPLFLYGVALAMSALGRTPYAVRVTAAVLGTLIIPATFLMGRALYDTRVGLWSAWWMAISPWPINLSRIGLRAVSMPLLVAVALWLWWSGRRRQGWRRVLLISGGGLFFGLVLYTYTAARFALIAVALYVLFQAVFWLANGRRWKEFAREWLSDLASLFLVAVLAMMPMAVYALAHWETFVERAPQVSIFNPEIGHGRPWRMLVGNFVRAVGLFAVRGDRIPRHNVPLRPLFDPLSSLVFLVGVGLCLAKARRGGAHALTLIWIGVMLVPTILAEDCPHFLRAVGVLPAAALLPALGLEEARGWAARRGRTWLSRGLVAGVLLAAAGWGLYDYWQHARSPDLAYAFEADQVQEAVEINRFLGTGWQGEGIRELRATPIPGRRVYLAPRLWEDRVAVNLLVGSPERTSILGRDAPPQSAQADEVLVLAWPFEDNSGVGRVLPSPAEVRVWPGPLERGDLDAEARLLYVAFYGSRLEDSMPAVARFEEGIELLDWEFELEGEGKTRVRLRWRATQPLSTDYTVFVHLKRDDTVLGQDDVAPGGGHYPTRWWRPGDEIVDEHVVSGSYDPRQDRIVVGWYEWSTMRHLRVVWREQGEPEQERLTLP
jgi:4-amino-4-deoxy-L-arabinose transferase-like glycosyltransferase